LPDGLHGRPTAGNKKGYFASKLLSFQRLMDVIRPGCGVGFNESGFTYTTLDAEPAPDQEDLPSLDVPLSLFDETVTMCNAPEVAAL
jgi:hypothetical protein